MGLPATAFYYVLRCFSDGLGRTRPAMLVGLAGLAREHRLHLIAGSFLLDLGQGRYRNRSDWFTPEGLHSWQERPMNMWLL